MRSRRLLFIAVVFLTIGAVGGGFGAASGDEAGSLPGERRGPVGVRFIESLAERDFAAARTMLTTEVEFKAFTPSLGFVDLTGPDAVMNLMEDWYQTAEAVEYLEAGRVLDRHNVGYRIRWASPDGPMVFQQHAFFDLDGSGRINRWHLVCSGDQAVQR